MSVLDSVCSRAVFVDTVDPLVRPSLPYVASRLLKLIPGTFFTFSLLHTFSNCLRTSSNFLHTFSHFFYLLQLPLPSSTFLYRLLPSLPSLPSLPKSLKHIQTLQRNILTLRQFEKQFETKMCGGKNVKKKNVERCET